ncbi:Protein of unknown function [Paenibacillus uliginis N3/975]|uniref:Uncharacterized protein n=1 Tax=Paenibacillus uliginis N3/975 TaxID=1313296 RepID=A0A1X7HK99_9BACL|nr:DUF3006 domain-containing protein [Paenibacillus uliginis]SMF88115.1 Protein of unknown function [Paenibacillus uliginis N3/975]
MIKGVIDRFEDDIAVVEVEDGKTLHYPKHLLPSDAEVGDVIKIDGNHFTVDKDETKKRRNEIDGLMNELFED